MYPQRCTQTCDVLTGQWGTVIWTRGVKKLETTGGVRRQLSNFQGVLAALERPFKCAPKQLATHGLAITPAAPSHAD